MRANAMAVKNSIMETRGLKRLYLYLRRANRRRVVLFLAASFLVVMVLAIVGFLFIQDFALYGQIFPGVTIDGKAVGGMSRAEAAELVKRSIAAPLMEPMVLVYDDDEYKLDLESIDLSIDVEAMVDKAYGEGKKISILSRMFRRFLNKPLHKDVPVIMKYDKAKVEDFIVGIAEDVNIPARSSSVDMSTGKPKVSSSKYGLRIKQEETINAIMAALPKGQRRMNVPVESVRPKVTEEDIGYIIVIRQKEYNLYLYNAGELVDTFKVAVGSPQYPTPNGQFTIVKKEKNPTWYPPKSDWAKEYGSKPIPPGPDNPLGPYWMEIGNGIGIHAATNENSLGYSASHGCIRVSEWAAAYLFDHVKKGSPVYIYP